MGRVGQGSVENAAWIVIVTTEHNRQTRISCLFMSFPWSCPIWICTTKFQRRADGVGCLFPWIMAEVTVPLRTLSVSFPMSNNSLMESLQEEAGSWCTATRVTWLHLFELSTTPGTSGHVDPFYIKYMLFSIYTILYLYAIFGCMVYSIAMFYFIPQIVLAM